VEVATARRTKKLRGYFIGSIGILAFAAMVQLLYILSLLLVYPRAWSGLLVWITMSLIVIGFLVGNRSAGRIRRKRIH
jgi:amino acid transporter